MADDDDESLSLTSPKLDALKALYSKAKVRLPNPNAPIHDNIHKYRSSLNPREKKVKTKVEKDDEPGPSASGLPKRRFLPHQEPIYAPRPQRSMHNVLSRMENITGPLAILKKCMDQRVRIKVFTRDMIGLRGYCIAFLAAFDKHWNLALEDVREVWTRRKRNKVPALDTRLPTLHPYSVDVSELCKAVRCKQEQVSDIQTKYTSVEHKRCSLPVRNIWSEK
ncbi:U7 snRNA-associated Sm-like protein LSm11 isoform X2 [Periplaneta americana]|uniref:U7 snRNA-associated Sm-like protein LSm11 isoform X2 n=1 Tax=Periplaneta americana TaxID=6978 RepID=UPI0037E72DDC